MNVCCLQLFPVEMNIAFIFKRLLFYDIFSLVDSSVVRVRGDGLCKDFHHAVLSLGCLWNSLCNF